MEQNKFTDDGIIEQLADLRATFDPETGNLTVTPGQVVMRQKYSVDGQWHDIYFTGGHCGSDFWEEEDLRQTFENDGHNLALKDLPVVLMPDRSSKVPAYSFDGDFFFVWDNPEGDEQMFHYANFFQNSGGFYAYNAVNCPGKMDENGLPVSPTTVNEGALEGWTTFVEATDERLAIIGGFANPVSNSNIPVEFVRTALDGKWHADNTLVSVYGNPSYYYVYAADENGNADYDAGLTVTWGEKDEWGNSLVGLPAWGTTLYYDEAMTNVFWPFSVKKDVATNIVVYRELPDMRFNEQEVKIDRVQSDCRSETPVYYNLQGIRICNPQKGEIVIECCGRESRKIVL